MEWLADILKKLPLPGSCCRFELGAGIKLMAIIRMFAIFVALGTPNLISLNPVGLTVFVVCLAFEVVLFTSSITRSPAMVLVWVLYFVVQFLAYIVWFVYAVTVEFDAMSISGMIYFPFISLFIFPVLGFLKSLLVEGEGEGAPKTDFEATGGYVYRPGQTAADYNVGSSGSFRYDPSAPSASQPHNNEATFVLGQSAAVEGEPLTSGYSYGAPPSYEEVNRQ